MDAKTSKHKGQEPCCRFSPTTVEQPGRSSRSYFRFVSAVSPGGSGGKESAWNVGDLGLIPGSRRSPGAGNGNPLQYPCLENSINREAWRAQSMGLQRVRHNWATKHTQERWRKTVRIMRDRRKGKRHWCWKPSFSVHWCRTECWRLSFGWSRKG